MSRVEGSGYIKLYRKFLEWEWYADENCKSVFLHCLLKANHKDKQWRGLIIHRGQFYTSAGTLAAELHLTAMQIRTSLSKLEKTGEIHKRATNEGTYITVCNYETYQPSENSEEQTDNKRITNKQQTDNKRITTTKNDKNDKNERSIVPPTLEMVVNYCKERNNTIDPAYFIDWNTARGWILKDHKMTDWQAAIRTWEKRTFPAAVKEEPKSAPIKILD